MACMNMYNSEHQNCSLIGPRISFSSDFVVDSSGPTIKHESATRPDLQQHDSSAPDFEFSATDDKYLTVAAADELFFKGRLLPMKENCRTLKDELLLEDDEEHVSQQSRPSKMPITWKGFLGKKGKAHRTAATKEVDDNAQASHEEKSSDGSAKLKDMQIGV